MDFDWADYLTFAREIKTRTDEAAKRSAISRAYYCVFNKARKYAENKLGYQYSSYHTSHKPIWDCFQNKGATFKAVRDNGLKLKDFREAADYKDNFENVDDSLTQAFRSAENALTYLNQIERNK